MTYFVTDEAARRFGRALGAEILSAGLASGPRADDPESSAPHVIAGSLESIKRCAARTPIDARSGSPMPADKAFSKLRRDPMTGQVGRVETVTALPCSQVTVEPCLRCDRRLATAVDGLCGSCRVDRLGVPS